MANHGRQIDSVKSKKASAEKKDVVKKRQSLKKLSHESAPVDKEKASGKNSKKLEAERPSARRSQRESTPSSKRRKFIVPAIAVAAIVLVAIVGCGFLLNQGKPAATEESFAMALPVGEDLAQPVEPTPKNPIDFATWQARNDQVHGWINVPGTKVDYPLLQDPDNANYYLWASVDREYSNDGEIYSQPVNGTDFTDPVTIYYGHTFSTKDTMLTTLHYFHDATFFEEHPEFYIYAPGRILRYDIVSIYECPNRLIQADYDFSDPEDVQAYFDYILNPTSQNPDVLQVREHERLTAGEDHVVQLITCTEPADTSKRFVVTGVLAEETLTEGFEGDDQAATEGAADGATDGAAAETTEA